jgi:murein DD-endopeptidase MepM/ murein hydrolase activator NlpD
MPAVVLALLALLLRPGSVAIAGECWHPPVTAPVADPFREPACRWCPGNRGLEYATSGGELVRAVAAGRVTFSGTVAETAYVVVEHADGRRATYGNLADRLFAVGDLVAGGALVGRAAGPVHFGLREGDRYVDPAPFIGRLLGIVRLVPEDGTASGPSPPPRLVCSPAPRSESPRSPARIGNRLSTDSRH